MLFIYKTSFLRVECQKRKSFTKAKTGNAFDTFTLTQQRIKSSDFLHFARLFFAAGARGCAMWRAGGIDFSNHRAYYVGDSLSPEKSESMHEHAQAYAA
jgi:hypothetical protein